MSFFSRWVGPTLVRLISYIALGVFLEGFGFDAFLFYS